MAPPLRVLITGGSGQLAQCLRKTQPNSMQAIYADRNSLNLEDHQAVKARLAELRPQFVINAAAYTKVDQAEKEKDAAFAINEHAVKNLAEVCRHHEIRLLHISTDFLFHGAFNRPIDEEQSPAPVGVYAESKFAGERAIVASGVSGAIIRTAWLYSEFGHNFMKTILRLGKEKPRLTVIADQHGSPTYAVDLAAALWRMLQTPEDFDNAGLSLWHFSNYGVTTWYDFAASILELAELKTPVEPILTSEYPVATPRPAYSALWPRKFSRHFSFAIRHWRVALAEAVAAYKTLLEGVPT